MPSIAIDMEMKAIAFPYDPKECRRVGTGAMKPFILFIDFFAIRSKFREVNVGSAYGEESGDEDVSVGDDQVDLEMGMKISPTYCLAKIGTGIGTENFADRGMIARLKGKIDEGL